ncbi:bactofilin family protein [Paenibacillus silviterrae]|uniref:bactofilin family protein n=1 Tax=Paenibacillus silviterrae TaxID=3242194 RepID=UPI00254398CF|nr:polymer-forming cytoskeletal protein [Paenibacillus chinjuensis]
MAMFKKMKPPLAVSGSAVTLIGEGSVIEGDLYAPADLRVEGEIRGRLRSEGEVVVGERGYVRSDLHAAHVIIAGRVEGIVRAEGTVRITATGKLSGTILAGSLIIEQGAVFQGKSDMYGGKEALPLQEAKEKEDAALSCVVV